MSKDHLTAKERETRKVTILLHGALTTILNGLEEKDYPHVFVSTNSSNLANILFDEVRFMEQFKLMFQDEERRLTIFDKALCLAMALERNKVITTSGLKTRIPKRLGNLNEKLITEIVLGYIAHSTYHVKRTDITRDFNFDGFNNGHKTDLKHLKNLLTEEFISTHFDYNKCLALLYDVYFRGLCYLEDISVDQAVSLKDRTTVMERYDAPTVGVVSTNTYSEYRKNFRSMK